MDCNEMANENKTNGTSTPLEKVSEKASAPSPSKLSTTKQSDPPEEAPSKSPPPPLAPPPHSPPPPSPSPSPPPPQAQHPPPQAQHPPPQAQHPPPQAQHPPPHSSPPPSKFSPPHSESSPPPTPPSESSTPPTPPSESSTPPTPPSSPSSSPPPPQPSDADSPPSQSNSPPSPQVPSAPSPSSQISPPLQNDPSLPQSASISPSSHSKPSFSPSNSDSLSKSSSSHDNTGQYIGFAVAGIFVLAVMAIIFVIVIKRKDKRGNFHGMPPPKKSQMKGDVHYYVESPGFGYNHMNNGGSIHPLRSPSEATPPQMSGGQILFSYDQILEITNGFSSENVIGEGGFGRVYKALMPDGRVGALKLLKAGSGQGEREFRAEVDTISRVHHRHLVSLIGYCIAEQQRVLIYEFVPNGNLDQHLHESQWNVLDWPKRMKIAIGAARGLAYLHEGCNPKIIHRDIKSSNILLDDSYEAQVADFGLARLTDDTNTHVSTRVMGTFGYMAPEYATSGKLTDRSDVFSFGVVLLELVTGRKPVDPTQPVGDESLVEWARPILLRAIETGDFSELADPRLHRQYIDSEMFRMIEAAAACIRHSAPKRPRMVQDLDPLLLQYGVASAGIIIFRERNNSRGLCLNLTVPTTAAVEIARALDSGDQLYDLSNGVKFGQSTIYDSGQYNEDIMRFKRMANGSFADSEFDMYSSEYSSRETSGSALVPKS